MKTTIFRLMLAGTFAVPALAQESPMPNAATKTFIDYFQPMPLRGALSRDIWGATDVLPRDPRNGLEDIANKFCYWDGQIIKGPDGRYHIFASRWDEARGHNGWFDSVAVHGVSDNLFGPYVDQGLCWPDNQGGKGHNVTALVLPDGRYAIVISETRPGTVFVSDSLDGPWTELGTIVAEGDTRKRASNYSVMVRPDGDFVIVPRSGQILLSKSGILGPYKAQGPSIYPSIPGLTLENLEDPVVWFSGGRYHIVVNSWSQRKAFHLTSSDGITNWTLRGLAYDPTHDFVRYTDGTVNRWHKLERPGVVLEDGHVVAVTLAVLDVPKNEEQPNDNHGSKVIVIPFDGAALDRDLQNAPPTAAAKPAGNPIASHLFTADPAARVYGDRLYVYTSHDEADSTYFDMFDWRLFSTADLATWQDHGSVFGLGGFAWAKQYAWAPDAIHANGKYHLFLPVDRTKIGVAVGDTPAGPFHDAIGGPLIDHATMPEVGPEPIDPALFIDDDGLTFMFFGCRNLKVVELDASLTRLAGKIQTVRLLDPDGKAIPVAAPDTQPALPMGYGEAPYLFKRAGKYYFVYSNGWAPASTLVYATGDSPTGPFTYVGELMKHVNCVTHHGSIVNFRDKWYVVYHTSDLSQGNTFRRAVCIDELTFDADGKIIPVTATRHGPTPLRL